MVCLNKRWSIVFISDGRKQAVRKLKAEGSQLYEEIVQLKMKAPDGKYYKTQ